MNKPSSPSTFSTTCPHDCPSTCGLTIDLDENGQMKKVRGARENTYTDGVICAKVARYAERIHHPDRLTKAFRRTGARGDGAFEEIDFDDALDEVAENFLTLAQAHGSETIWPYYFAGTMGLVQRDCINFMRHAMKYSGEHTTICTTPAWSGYAVGTGRLGGVDPREMAASDCVVIWGTNPVATQVNVMTHAVKARKERGAKIVVVDIYETGTMKQADHKVILRPGTDAALACAIMHVLFEENLADWDFLNAFTDDPEGLHAHLKDKTPTWAAGICGVDEAQIIEVARLIGTTKRTYFRLGYGMTRQQNGAVAMHAVTSIAAVTGAWQYEGGGAFHSNSGSFPINNFDVQGVTYKDPEIRTLDQSRIGAVLCGDAADLYGGPPVTGLFIQNTNPMVVAPDLKRVWEGFAREDLFTVVHEHFMTETAKVADIVLPATMFTEHNDIYRGGGHTHLSLGLKAMEAPGACCSNYEVVRGLAKRLGVNDPMFDLSDEQHVARVVATSGTVTLDDIRHDTWHDTSRSFDDAHYRNGFAWPDGKYRFKPVWDDVVPAFKAPVSMTNLNDAKDMPAWPDHWAVTEATDDVHPFKLATSPARQFLNTSFTETKTSVRMEGEPFLLLHPNDAAAQQIDEGSRVTVGNQRGAVTLKARIMDGLVPGVLIAEGIWPNAAHEKGEGINTLISADPIRPFGGAAFHDCAVWLKKAD